MDKRQCNAPFITGEEGADPGHPGVLMGNHRELDHIIDAYGYRARSFPAQGHRRDVECVREGTGGGSAVLAYERTVARLFGPAGQYA